MFKKIVLYLAALASLTLAACNTIEGAGRDVSATGHAVTDTARETKNNM